MSLSRRSAALAAAGFVALCSGASAATFELPVTDDEAGVTCEHHLAAARGSWIHRGGDWVDADGMEQGATPFATATMDGAAVGTAIGLDVTTLVRQWYASGRQSGLAMLRATGVNPRGVVDFASRESATAAHRPRLTIEWSDGESTTLAPTADASIVCTTAKSLGALPTIRVGGGASSLLAFPLDPATGRHVERATLTLTVDRRTGGAIGLGVFHVVPPWARESTARAGIAARHPGDMGIDADPAVIFATGFDAGDWREGWSTVGERSIADVVANGEGNGFEPLLGRALRVKLMPHQNLGLDLRYEFARVGLKEPEEAYFRYYLRFGEDWKPVRDGGKLPGFAGTYNRGGWGLRKADGTNGWSARGAFFRQPSEAPPAMTRHVGIGSYVYHADARAGSADAWGWGLGPTGWLSRNRWYSIEQYVKLNAPGRADGVMRAWVDGHLVMERTGLRFRDVPELRIESVWFNVYHGGVTKPANPMSLYIDNVVIAREYIGPLQR